MKKIEEFQFFLKEFGRFKSKIRENDFYFYNSRNTITINSYKDNNFELEITEIDKNKKLSFFKDFSYISQFSSFKIVLSKTLPINIDKIKKYIQLYFSYRDIILDIAKIASNHVMFQSLSERCGSMYIRSLSCNLIMNTLIKCQNISIENFPILDKKTITQYFNKVLQILEILSNNINAEPYYIGSWHSNAWNFAREIPIINFTVSDNFPFSIIIVKVKDYYSEQENNCIKDKLFAYLSFLNISCLPIMVDICRLTADDIQLQFLVSCLFHYNLQNLFLTKIQQKILELL